MSIENIRAMYQHMQKTATFAATTQPYQQMPMGLGVAQHQQAPSLPGGMNAAQPQQAQQPQSPSRVSIGGAARTGAKWGAVVGAGRGALAGVPGGPYGMLLGAGLGGLNGAVVGAGTGALVGGAINSYNKDQANKTAALSYRKVAADKDPNRPLPYRYAARKGLAIGAATGGGTGAIAGLQGGPIGMAVGGVSGAIGGGVLGTGVGLLAAAIYNAWQGR